MINKNREELATTVHKFEVQLKQVSDGAIGNTIHGVTAQNINAMASEIDFAKKEIQKLEKLHFETTLINKS